MAYSELWPTFIMEHFAKTVLANYIYFRNITFPIQFFNPVDTRRCFNDDTTSYDIVRRPISVETISCVCGEETNIMNFLNTFLFIPGVLILRKQVWEAEGSLSFLIFL